MIETDRLKITPLTFDQLKMYIKCDGSLEDSLHLRALPRIISVELKEALEGFFLPNLADPSNNYLHYTLWTAVLKVENCMVADLCIIGSPNHLGEIEIGYGTYKAFEGNGYMSEIVGGMLHWFKTQPEIKVILAKTDITNIGSFTVLEKNKFIKTGQTASQFEWKIDNHPATLLSTSQL